VKCIQHRERRDAFGRDVVRGHVGHRRTRRTRFGHARRGAGVTASHCAALSTTHACRPWQVAGPGGVDLPAGAPPAACHWPPERRTSPAMPSASLHVQVAPARPYLPQPTFPRAYKPVPAVPRVHAFPPEPPSSVIAAARCDPFSGHFPHTPKIFSPSLCTTTPPRAAC
jgi:hypothetical protein